MYQEIKGNIFDSKADVLANPVNCKGVMGAGLALAFAERFPAYMVGNYKKVCTAGILVPGRPYLERETSPWILQFPTKNHWKESSNLAVIERGLEYFVSHYNFSHMHSIAFPKLGCGLGNLSWEKEVCPLMRLYLLDLRIDVEVYI